MLLRTTRAVFATALSLGMLTGDFVIAPMPAFAQAAQNATISGNVADQQTGLGLANADVVLYQGRRRVAEARTDNNGAFSFQNQAPGIYDIEVSAEGYQRSRLSDQAVTPGSSGLSMHIVLPHAASSDTGLRVIGKVSATTRSALATTTVINRSIDPYIIENEANMRNGDALLAQPGLTSFNLDSAPGDDLNISIRGERPSEAQFLIDGHPTGPIGVFNTTAGGFNYQLSPSAALRNILITYGTGGSSLNGVDAIAGTIDYQTIDPTLKPEFRFTQGGGTQGRLKSIAQSTGTVGKLGYAFVYGTEGSYGNFSPRTVTQGGLLAGDATSGNVAANTWSVSGNYLLRNALGKLRYQVSPTTAVTFSAYNATSWDDKTGEGDNDFATPEFVLYSAQQAGNTCTLPGGGTGYVAATDASPTTCMTPGQYAATFSGPAGGTALAFQALHLQDYNARITSTIGKHNLLVEGFENAYYQYYDRSLAGFTNSYLTTGGRISDDIVMNDRNTLGFGYISTHEAYVGGTYGPNGVKNNPMIPETIGNFFVRNIYNPTPSLQIFTNLNVTHSTVSNSTQFNPRLSFVYNPKGSDIYRVSLAKGSESPNAQLKSGIPTVTTQPGAVNPSCGGVSSIGNAPNPTLVDEKANSIELSYGHRFSNDSQFQAVAYDQELTNVVFSSVLPLTTFGAAAIPANLQAYLDRLAQLCQRPGTIAMLGLTTPANAGAGRFRGVGATERYRFNRAFFVDGGIDLLSARYYGIPMISLQRNVTLIDGGQIVGVPFMKANLGLDYTFKDRTEVRVDGYFVGRNNALYRPPFGYANGFINHPLTKNLTVNLGVSNMFNSAFDQYGRFGLAQFIPENQFGTDNNALSQEFSGNYGERFGLPERSFLLSLTARVR